WMPLSCPLPVLSGTLFVSGVLALTAGLRRHAGSGPTADERRIFPVRGARVDQDPAALVAQEEEAGLLKPPPRDLVALDHLLDDGRRGALDNLVADADLGSIAVAPHPGPHNSGVAGSDPTGTMAVTTPARHASG